MKKSIASLAAGLLLVAFTSTAAAQTALVLNQSASFSQAASSTAEYLLNLDAPGVVTIRISDWISTFDWTSDYDRLYVRNSDGVPVAKNSFGTDADPFLFHMFAGADSLTFNIGKAGSYSISIHSGEAKPADWGSSVTQNYSISASLLECADTQEQNDTLSSAVALQLNTPVSGYQWKNVATSDVRYDEDWYSVTVPSPGRLTLSLVDWIGTYNWGYEDRLYVYNAAGVSIGSSGGNPFYNWMMGGGTDTCPDSTTMNLSHAGTYYLRYYSGAGTSTVPYSLTASFTAADDVFEPNDTLTQAKEISSGTWYDAFAWRTIDSSMTVWADKDCYSFTAPDAGSYTLELLGWIGIYDWGADFDHLHLYDSSGKTVGGDRISHMMNTDPIPFTVPAAGKYTLELHCGSGYTIDGYQFRLNGSTVGIRRNGTFAGVASDEIRIAGNVVYKPAGSDASMTVELISLSGRILWRCASDRPIRLPENLLGTNVGIVKCTAGAKSLVKKLNWPGAL